MDRGNQDDMFKIIKEDFNWIKEDIEEYILLLREKMVTLISDGKVMEIEECKEKHEDLTKIKGKLSKIISKCI